MGNDSIRQHNPALYIMLAPQIAGDKITALRASVAALAEAETELAEAMDASAEKVLISDAWRAYVASPDRPDSGSRTLSDYLGQWERFAQWVKTTRPGVIEMRHVTPEIAREYARDLSSSGVSPNTYNKHLNVLRLVYKHLADTARIDINPWGRISHKRQRVHSRRELTTEEITRVCETATGEMRVAFAVGIYTGLRLGDVCTLRWDAVSLERGLIHLTPRKTARRNGHAVTIPIHRSLSAATSHII